MFGKSKKPPQMGDFIGGDRQLFFDSFKHTYSYHNGESPEVQTPIQPPAPAGLLLLLLIVSVALPPAFFPRMLAPQLPSARRSVRPACWGLQPHSL
jgi:hypothetical protein